MRVLVLNSTYEPINFVSEIDAIKLLIRNKVDPIDYWDEYFGKFQIPSVLKLKYYVRWIPQKIGFTKKMVFVRDNFVCQYCLQAFTEKELTIDHVMPESRGGQLNWVNCVSACFKCNNEKKKNLTPEEANMILKSPPFIPRNKIYMLYRSIYSKHPSWSQYFV